MNWEHDALQRCKRVEPCDDLLHVVFHANSTRNAGSQLACHRRKLGGQCPITMRGWSAEIGMLLGIYMVMPTGRIGAMPRGILRGEGGKKVRNSDLHPMVRYLLCPSYTSLALSLRNTAPARGCRAKLYGHSLWAPSFQTPLLPNPVVGQPLTGLIVAFDWPRMKQPSGTRRLMTAQGREAKQRQCLTTANYGPSAL